MTAPVSPVEAIHMDNSKSCIGCKFLYTHDSGYSNYTVEETVVCCAKDKNPNLSDGRPWDWKHDPDNWPKTNQSRCELYAAGNMVCLDVDGEVTPEECTSDQEAIDAIRLHAGIK